jgi:hypothetical protein
MLFALSFTVMLILMVLLFQQCLKVMRLLFQTLLLFAVVVLFRLGAILSVSFFFDFRFVVLSLVFFLQHSGKTLVDFFAV